MMAQLLFERAEYAERLARLRAAMTAARVDYALFDEIEAMSWLSGYGNSENRWRCVFVPLQGEPFFLIRALDAEPCRQRTWIERIAVFRDWEDPTLALAEEVRAQSFPPGRVGLDFGSYGTSLRRFEQLRAALPGWDFADVGAIVAELRLIKSPAEIALLRRASAVCDAAMLRAADACRPGANLRAAARAAMDAFMEGGADPSAPGPISAGRGWDFLHGHLTDTPLAPGDVAHIELTPRVSGYSARIMRCVSIGSPAAELEAASRTLVALQDRQIAAMRPGARARDVDAILREGVIGSGLRESYDNITGYTLGLYAPATPRTSDFTRILHPQADWAFEPGMVMHVYASARGVSISETVLVGANGPERLTQLPRTLIVHS